MEWIAGKHANVSTEVVVIDLQENVPVRLAGEVLYVLSHVRMDSADQGASSDVVVGMKQRAIVSVDCASALLDGLDQSVTIPAPREDTVPIVHYCVRVRMVDCATVSVEVARVLQVGWAPSAQLSVQMVGTARAAPVSATVYMAHHVTLLMVRVSARLGGWGSVAKDLAISDSLVLVVIEYVGAAMVQNVPALTEVAPASLGGQELDVANHVQLGG